MYIIYTFFLCSFFSIIFVVFVVHFSFFLMSLFILASSFTFILNSFCCEGKIEERNDDGEVLERGAVETGADISIVSKINIPALVSDLFEFLLRGVT